VAVAYGSLEGIVFPVSGYAAATYFWLFSFRIFIIFAVFTKYFIVF
jgi:hypothetical protein